MGEWKNCTLSSLGTIVGGATPSTKKPENYEGGTIPWITPKDLSGFLGRYISHGERYITEKGLNSCSAQMMPKYSVLFSSRAPIGYVAISNCEVCTNQGFKSIVPNENTDYLFLYYLLRYKKKDIENLGSGTTFKEVSANTIKSVEVRIPAEKSEQEKIASVLSAIDDKIEVNSNINENLEQQLAALFSHIFADDISKASIDTCPMLGDLINVIDNRGKTPPLTTDTIEYPIIDVGALKGAGRIVDFNNCTKYVNKATYETWFRSGHPKSLDILLSTVGSLAELKIYLGTRGCIAQNVVALRATSISPLYLYQYLRFIRADLVAYNIGSVQPSIKVTHIIKHPIFVPETSILETFEETAKAITEQLYANYNENESLKELREALLPKLMSGEIDISKFQL
ncbi:restriction endonuclease subunit S [Phascolarctobacterium sp.]|uniref:restriction endonuclease subunit S n=1 Tax=Phascolarctobacterium sp. TaxID=2049039 RepID=UPI003F7E4E07